MIEIKGGADEFEAAVIGVVVDHIRAEERARKNPKARKDNGVPAWIRALRPDAFPDPRLRPRT